jgi:hypothetical protein
VNDIEQHNKLFQKNFPQIFCDFKQCCTFAIPIANNANGKQKFLTKRGHFKEAIAE